MAVAEATNAKGRPEQDAPTIHATAISVGGEAILFRGPSGAGKSDLALRCLAQPPLSFARAPVATQPCRLVADDRCKLTMADDGSLMVSPPQTLAGRIEVRQLGILDVDHEPTARVRLIVDLVAQPLERLPEALLSTEALHNVSVPCAQLYPWDASAPIRALLLLDALLSNATSQDVA